MSGAASGGAASGGSAASDPAPGGLALVFGASGGVGGALCRALRARGGYAEVIALSRHPPPDGPGRRIPFDLLDEDSIAAAALAVSGLGAPTLVIVATGLLHDGAVQPEKSYRALSAEALQRLFAVNLIGPALIAKHILPLMPRAGRSVFAVLSARVGSIGDNRAGGWYGYRSAKAALNMLVKTLAVEHARTHPEGVCVALHPGTVRTPLSAPFAGSREMLTPDRSAAALLGVLDAVTPEQTGGFIAWDGAPIPW